MKHAWLNHLICGASCALFPLSAHAGSALLSGTPLADGGGEILSYYAPSGLIANTYSNPTSGQHGVRFTQLNADGTLSTPTVNTVNLTSSFADNVSANGVYNLSSVQVDNQGRDFGVATLIPGTATGFERLSVVGRAVFFQISTGAVLGSVNVGYHPDSISITPDGTKLIVANEAELPSLNSAQANATQYALNDAAKKAGSVSLINLSGVTSASDLGVKLAASQIGVTDVGFTGINLSGIRIHASAPTTIAAEDRHRFLEPEYIAANNTKAYVSLQENNAIATIDLATGMVDSVRSLGTLSQTIDQSDRDGLAGIPGGASNPKPSINISTVRTGLLMPDTIATFQKGGETYILTANEGDSREDSADETRLTGNTRLKVIATGVEGEGNTYGTRSATIVRASDGVIVWDSSDGQGTAAAFKSFEEYIRDNDKATFGMDQNAAFAFRPASDGVVGNFTDGIFTNGLTGTSLAAISDSRTDDKGPEPEAIAYGSSNGRDFMFVGMERQGGIFGFDITDLNNIFLVDYINLVERAASAGQAYLSPETIRFITGESNPTGKDLLLIGYENPTQAFGGLAVIDVSSVTASAIPEPSTYAALFGAGALGFALVRRRRVTRLSRRNAVERVVSS